MTKKEKKKGRAFETRALVCNCRGTVYRYGFDNVSVDRIVEEAGLQGTFYVHLKQRTTYDILISDYVRKVDMDYQAFIDTFSPDYRQRICSPAEK